MRTTNRVIAWLALCLVVIAVGFFAAGIAQRNGPATTAALVAILSGIFAWIGAS